VEGETGVRAGVELPNKSMKPTEKIYAPFTPEEKATLEELAIRNRRPLGQQVAWLALLGLQTLREQELSPVPDGISTNTTSAGRGSGSGGRVASRRGK
jgi:hypothetical protein